MFIKLTEFLEQNDTNWKSHTFISKVNTFVPIVFMRLISISFWIEKKKQEKKWEFGVLVAMINIYIIIYEYHLFCDDKIGC